METKKKFKGSYGTLAFIETPNGDLRLTIDVVQGKHSTEETMHKLRAILLGMKYMYSHNDTEVFHLGEAFLDGLETGMNSLQKAKKPTPSSGEGGATMGFHANI